MAKRIYKNCFNQYNFCLSLFKFFRTIIVCDEVLERLRLFEKVHLIVKNLSLTDKLATHEPRMRRLGYLPALDYTEITTFYTHFVGKASFDFIPMENFILKFISYDS